MLLVWVEYHQLLRLDFQYGGVLWGQQLYLDSCTGGRCVGVTGAKVVLAQSSVQYSVDCNTGNTRKMPGCGVIMGLMV